MKISTHLYLFGLILCVLFFVSCKTEGPIKPDPEPTITVASVRTDLIENVGNQLIIPAYEDLKTKTDDLVNSVNEFHKAPDVNKLSAVQAALKADWLSWQRAAIYLFGPSESQGLRQALATYPTDSSKIEANISSGNYVLGTLDNKSAVGFPALDYLLNGLADTPEATVEAYTFGDQAVARLTYLNDLVTVIQSKVNATLEGWQASGGNYIADFTSEDALGTDVGSSLGLLTNSIDLHFQRFVRDGKIAIPAGIRSAGVPRPTTIEAKYGKYSVALLIASLEAYENLFLGIDANGADGTGFYDYLVQLEANGLADDVKAQYVSTTSLAKTLTDPLESEIENELEKVTNVFLEMQKLVVFFKSDMASVMGISITNQDNDGD